MVDDLIGRVHNDSANCKDPPHSDLKDSLQNIRHHNGGGVAKHPSHQFMVSLLYTSLALHGLALDVSRLPVVQRWDRPDTVRAPQRHTNFRAE
jgi:hypothetical protein